MIEQVFESRSELASVDVAHLTCMLRAVGSDGDTASEQIDLIRRLEELKSAAAAAQARVTATFAAGQRSAQEAAGAPPSEVAKGIAAQVALARRESPHRAASTLAWPRLSPVNCLTRWMPWSGARSANGGRLWSPGKPLPLG